MSNIIATLVPQHLDNSESNSEYNYHPNVYINEGDVYSHYISKDSSEGFIEFDGRSHIFTESIPSKYILNISEREETPYKIVNNTQYFRCLYEYSVLIEVKRKEVIEDTSTTSEIEDDDGTMMNVCFMPTERQKIWFSVLEWLED